MIGVTITSGDKFHDLTKEAVRRFKKYTGIKTVIVFDTDITGRNVYLTKLRLHTFFNQSFVFFDSDLWFVDHCNLTQFDNLESFVAVKDVGRNSEADFPIEDCYINGIDNNIYFNSGFFIANAADQKQKNAFDYASQLTDRVTNLDFGEQTYLNTAIQRKQIPITFLDNKYNYPIICDQMKHKNPDHIPNDSPIAIHAMGYKGSDKFINLTKYIQSQ
jgi:lipopolysaccharide biosynthesis glycosyltransferase